MMILSYLQHKWISIKYCMVGCTDRPHLWTIRTFFFLFSFPNCTQKYCDDKTVPQGEYSQLIVLYSNHFKFR